MSDRGDDSRPNVLLVLTDQQRWDTVGAYGSPMDLTPTLDAMAARGVKLERAFTAQPVCGPARGVLQTGRYATQHGVWRSALPLSADERTLAHEFADGGYEVGYVGDWHLAGTVDDPVPPERRGGYDDFWLAADVPEFTSRPYEGALYDGDGEAVPFETYRADAFTDFAVEALETLGEPYFLVVSYLEPHDQNDMWTFVAPDGYADRYRKNPYVPPDLRDRPGEWYEELPDYYGMCKRIDECLGRLLSALERLGQDDETVFLFTSDHGCHFRTRPGEYKRSCHEASIRVPAVVRGPGFDRGRTLSEIVSHVDLPPTLLDAAGLDVPDRMEGRSVVPLLSEADAGWADEAFVQISESEIGRAIRTDRWKYAVSAPTMNGWRGGVGEERSDLYVERYLYDLHRDPAERINLVGRPEYRDVTDGLRERLEAHVRRVEGYDPEIRPFENPGYREY
ncbi:sulfatase-like hydrolase/transferase [Halegenticoccus tardaugens]|uniref:sulfatase-like hydrolase/transferase n=1 Tax=Halegenticoccus tardaugens TaxID=2071624 RepID=UPI00100B7117|nr:sulfatase-like hydrolase/transferase [Halegenticoccus tardaugens]